MKNTATNCLETLSYFEIAGCAKIVLSALVVCCNLPHVRQPVSLCAALVRQLQPVQPSLAVAGPCFDIRRDPAIDCLGCPKVLAMHTVASDDPEDS